MKKLENIILSCRITEMNGAADRIILKYEEVDYSTDKYLPGYFNSLKTENNKLQIAINYSKAQSDLDAKDEIRDENVRGLNHMLSAYLKFANPETKKAAVNVDAVFRKYGVEIVQDSYVTESSLINSMLQDFAAPEIQLEIAKLPGLAALITELSTAQSNFENARVAYETAMANDETKENATKLKQNVGLIINGDIVEYLNLMAKLNPETYEAFALAVGKIIDETNEQVRKRRKKVEPEPVAE